LQVKDSSEIVKYTFQVSNAKDFSNIIREADTAANHYKLIEKLDKGDYYWRVSGTTSDGKKTSFSDAGKFTVHEQLEINLLNPPDNYNAEIDSMISFQWQKLPYRGKFILDISDNPDFTNKVHSVTTSNYAESHKFSSEGKFYWRVISLGEDDTILAKSKIKHFKIEDVQDVVPIFPNKNNKVDMSFSDSLTFKWENNPKVDQFEVKLYQHKKGKKELVISHKTKSNSYKLRDLLKLDEGNFSWTLQGFFREDENLQPGKKMEIPFKIYLSDKKKSPEVETPKKMYVE
jgi:hypothetical protein